MHYKDVCDATHMSIQGFYDVKASLEEKGFIVCEKCDYSDCDITIVGNSYDGEKYNREGYINTGYNIFFHKMSLSIKGRREASGVKTSYHLFFRKGFF